MINTEILVIGSGPGGALTAAKLAEAGRAVTLIEEGAWIDVGDYEPFSLDQMGAQYRNAGITVTAGRVPIAYSEGRCAGGGSEINSGLYHRPDAALLTRWANRYGIIDLTPEDLAPHANEVEATLGVTKVPGEATPASLALERGARRLGWSCREVPRWMRYPACSDAAAGERQSMTRTYLPRVRAAGAVLETGCRAEELITQGRRVTGVVASRGAERIQIRAEHVFVCAGTTQTPSLLKRSGINTNIGRAFAVHPMVKAVARFDEPINVPSDVPVHQVNEFSPNISMGGSASRPGLIGLALSSDLGRFGSVVGDWERCSLYYAATRSEGRGRVLRVPGLRDPLVTYHLTRNDGAVLTQAMTRLVHLLLASGARAVYPSMRGANEIRQPSDVAELARRIRLRDLNIMTVHLCSSVPMGGDPERSAADPFGRIHGFDNLRVNDSSLLPDAPGINPQGTVMAIASRNCAHFLEHA